VSAYLDHLPALYRQDRFLGDFLRSFETVFGELEARIADVPRYLDPATTDAEFLPWLSGWVALTLRADWDEDTRRNFLGKIVPLYRSRGTRPGLQQMLELYTGGQRVDIVDDFDAVPHFFQVQVTLAEPDPALLRRKQEIARAIIDQEKPAHTFYALRISVPTMRLVSRALQDRARAAKRTVPPRLILGSNTLLGTTITEQA
jgi:phage tail-like protein